jgi:hypothetical protein
MAAPKDDICAKHPTMARKAKTMKKILTFWTKSGVIGTAANKFPIGGKLKSAGN